MPPLEQRSRGALRPSPGAVYPALAQLGDEGLVRAETTNSGRLYHLTERGKAYVAAALQVDHTGSTAQIAEAQKNLNQTRRALYRLLAEDAPEDDE